ncbi:MAG: hypothetical protein JW874_03995 [Spirochaetales bacterium]|nr:hypothetical protein [Spirochaetales bacterium]
MITDREEQAKIEAGNTRISKRTALVLTGFFLACIAAVPLVQAVHEAAEYGSGKTKSFLPSFTDIFVSGGNSMKRLFVKNRGFFASVMDANEYLLDGIITYEDNLETDSVFRKAAIPPFQRLFIAAFALGNGKAVIGRDGWLFYEPGLHYLTSSGTENAVNVNRSSSKANTIFHEKKTSSLDAILDFGRQLGERGIELVLLPAPVKPMFYPEQLSAQIKNPDGYLQNPLFVPLKRELEQNGIRVFDAAEYVNAHRDKLRSPVFLRTDTHWSPGTVSLVAGGLARFIENETTLDLYNYNSLDTVQKTISNTGDIARMLSPSVSVGPVKPEQTEISQVLQNGNDLWSPDRNAEILFLGDSFSNIYSQENMGWGESAGLVEQLSRFMNRPVDRIIQNDNGAYATRQSLQYELSRGRDRLAGKKVVVWEFALRELVLGDWKKLGLALKTAEPSAFFVPERESEAVVTGMILETSSRPVPKTTPYKDHVMTFHLVDASVNGLDKDNFEILVYAFSMIDYEPTALAGYRAGQKVSLRLKNWYDVENKYNSINRSELDNDDLLFEDPCWCEELLE